MIGFLILSSVFNLVLTLAGYYALANPTERTTTAEEAEFSGRIMAVVFGTMFMWSCYLMWSS
jgi:hypothetical protein